MPKEVLHGDDEFRAVVTWRKDDTESNTPGHVQIAVLNETIDDPDQTGAAGWFKDLDADQIDYLITVLRKARRQAFPVRNTVTFTEERINALHKKELDLRFEHSEAKYELRVAHREAMKAKQKAD